MKYLLPLLCLLFSLITPSSGVAQEKKPYVVYAEFVADTQVDVSDGSKWKMDKGDCFPIHMFKDRQTKVVLQLAGATFMTDAYNVRILKDSEAERALKNYRKMVDNYLKTQADR
ncbi:MAG: hypothetical protein EOP84_06400 [Verrucomicrobiaceae bacterium]|nr:MAG: hypothetical protein EOP84_06400 [Verrucomicrobiaceae bacterium]